MTRRRAPRLLSDVACAWLSDWLRDERRRQRGRGSDHPKRALQRELRAVQRLAADLEQRLVAGPAAALLDHLLYQASDLRPRLLVELATVTGQALDELQRRRSPQPVAGAAELYLHLLYRAGSRWPLLMGNDVDQSPEVAQFAAILAAAGADGGADRARKALTAARSRFDRQMPPGLLDDLLRAGL